MRGLRCILQSHRGQDASVEMSGVENRGRKGRLSFPRSGRQSIFVCFCYCLSLFSVLAFVCPFVNSCFFLSCQLLLILCKNQKTYIRQASTSNLCKMLRFSPNFDPTFMTEQPHSHNPRLWVLTFTQQFITPLHFVRHCVISSVLSPFRSAIRPSVQRWNYGGQKGCVLRERW